MESRKPTTFGRTAWRYGLGALLASLATVACGAQDGGSTQSAGGEPLTPRLQAIQSDLSIGSQGEDVRALHDYLRRFGYFPNDELASEYPEWSPLVAEGPAEDDVFDAQTELAVRALQRHGDLPETGVVDAATRNLLLTERCGVPEGMAAVDPADKYAVVSPWNKGSLTWRLMNTDDVPFTQAEAAVTAAFASWAAQSSIGFTEVTSGTADIQITFAAIDGAGGILGATYFPAGGGDMTIDTAETWSTASPTPVGATDLQTVVLHELGHAVGIHHSSLTSAVMYPFYGGQRRALTAEDDVPESVLYDLWQQVSGLANDISVGANGAVWILGNTSAFGGWSIQKWNGSGWDTADSVAIRIAVSPTGIPWMIGPTNNIYRRTAASATTGSWQQVTGCAHDIAIGANGDVWILGCETAFGGWSIKKWNGTGWDTADGVASRIAVGPTGIPVVVTPSGGIVRRTAASATSGTWGDVLPGLGMNPDSHTDIAVDPNGYTYLIGSGDTGYILDQNQEIKYSDGTIAAPGANQWLGLHTLAGLAIAGGPLGSGTVGAWFVKSDKTIYRNVR